MAFTSGEKILASDVNELIDDTNDIFALGFGDRGYGETPLPNVSAFPSNPLDKVDNEEWLDIREALERCGTHQGSVPTLPSVGDIEDGDMTMAFPEFLTAIDQVTTNRLNVGPTSTTITNGVLTSTRLAASPWSAQIEHRFTVDFGDEDSARHFFNTGGQIRIDMDAPNTLAAHNWGGIYDLTGTVIFDHSDYFGLSATLGDFTTVSLNTMGGGLYSAGGLANAWLIQATYVEGTTIRDARGSKIEIRSISSDNYAGNPLYPSSPDVVVGDFISTISERRSTGEFPRPAPTYTTLVDLTAGS